MGTPALHIRGQVLVGPEETLGEVWAIDGRISLTPPVSGEVETVEGWALPGLVDAHCHVGLEIEGAVSRERAEEHALADRDAGALLLRSPGSPADTSWMAAREDMPVMLHGGRHLARPKRYLRGFGHEIEPEDLVEYARAEARAGDGWVKFVGDWIDREVGDLAPLWPADVLAEAVAAVHEEGARTTAHCFGEQSLRDFAAAGTDCIEHATGLQEDTVAAFAEQQIAIVPTLVNIANFPHFAAAGEAKFPTYAAHMRDLHARRYETIAMAREAGVPVYVGTDAGGQLPHGLIAREIVELTHAGFDPVAAIGAATWAARRWLGRPGIEEGAPADLVVYAEDPREDLRALASPHRVVLNGQAHESLGRHHHPASA